MSKSNKRSRSRNRRPISQEARPFPHGSGYSAKKCRGKRIYLGRIADDPDGGAAWEEWLRIGEDVRNGVAPSKSTGGIRRVCELRRSGQEQHYPALAVLDLFYSI